MWVVCFLLAVPGNAAATSRWWVSGWAAPHVTGDWGAPESIFRDPISGELLLCDARNGTVIFFDGQGIERFSLNTTTQDLRTGRTQRGEPRSAVERPSGLVYISDRIAGTVGIYSYRGDRLGELEVGRDLGVDPATLRTEQVALDARGLLYVSTSGAAAGVAVYDERDSLVAALAYDLDEYQRPEQPGALAVDALGGVWLADLRGFPVIRHYGADGRYLGGFARRDAAPKDLSYPSAVLCAQDGSLWVADAIRQVVKHYTADGDFLEQIGGYGVAPGDLQYPSGLAGDGVKELLVCERVGRRVQRYYLPDAGVSTTAEVKEATQRTEAVP